MVQALGALSARQRRNFVPWRKRPPVKWSNWTSTTSLVSRGSHSEECLVLQRLGPPGTLPVKPGGLIKTSTFFVNGGCSFVLNEEGNPTVSRRPLSLKSPSSSDPIRG